MKKVLSLLLVLIIIGCLFSFVACNKAVVDDSVVITIRVPATTMEVFLDNEIHSTADFLKKAADQFSAQYSKKVKFNIVEYEGAKQDRFLTSYLGTDATPDLIFDSYWNIKSYAYDNKLVAVDDLFGTTLLHGMDEDAIEASKVDGKLLLAPFYSQQYVLACNRDVLTTVFDNGKKKGVGPDTSIEAFANSDKTKIQSLTSAQFESLFNYLVTYKGSYVYPYMMYADDSVGDMHTMALLKDRGAELFDGTGKYSMNNTEGINALNYILSGKLNRWFPTRAENFTYNDCIDLFLSGQLAFMAVSTSNLSQFAKLNVGFVNFPSTTSDKGYCETFYTGFGVINTGNAEKEAICKDFVSYIYAEKNDLLKYSVAGLPAVDSVVTRYKDKLYTFIEGGQPSISISYDAFIANKVNSLGGVVDTYSVLTNGTKNLLKARNEFSMEIKELLRGSKTPAEVAEYLDGALK